MPLGKYKTFAECVAANRKKRNPQAYCGAIEHKMKKGMKKKMEKH